MTMQDFDYMDGIAKTEILSLMGIFLGTRRDGCFRISLYQVENFYVELYYHLSQGCYVSLRSFEDVGGLNPYLEDIDISAIYASPR
ncbi:MAG TPA: hypothetical protein VK543_00605 [Puia sp.]|nr:hypothetical protein [Puia sp.]